MEKLFTLQEQQQHFEAAQSFFLQGNYKEAEPLLRLVIESAFQHQDYPTYVSAIIFLNRTFINISQFDKMHSFLLILAPFISEHGTPEDYYYYRMHQVIFNNHYLIGDVVADYEALLNDSWTSEDKNLTFLIASNLIYTYIEKNEIERGIALFEKLEHAYQGFEFTNKMTLYMHYIYAFLLFYLKEDYKQCQLMITTIQENPKVHIVDSFSYMLDICNGLLQAQIGDIHVAKEVFKQGVEKTDNLLHIRFEMKLWVDTLKKFDMKDDVILYQDMLIRLLDKHYDSEMSAMRKQSMEDRSRQFYEGQIYVDQLTNVKNRNFYEDLLAKQQQVKNYTVAVLDIDHFKSINDTYGHTVGDEAIQFVAKHLAQWNPHHDISVIRFGGDEFILLMPYPIEEMKLELQLLHQQMMHTPFHIKKLQQQIPISISMGVGYTGERYQTIDVLFEAADKTIYEAKRSRGAIIISEVDATFN